MGTTVRPSELARRNAGALASLALPLVVSMVPIATVVVSVEVGPAGHPAASSPAMLGAHLAAVSLAQFLGHFAAGSAAMVALGVLALAFGSRDGLGAGCVNSVLAVLGRCARALFVGGAVEPLAQRVEALPARRRRETVPGVLEQLRRALVISPAAPPVTAMVQHMSIEERAEAGRP